ncbi:TonB-dependent receptor [Caulobacter sp. RHG1]|uniref:TonB-dependent receptor n=1 Tax=Caulobacter sp. (strain RHG1) TaxID=2545762 RepID=UPI0019D51F0E|nr:TonB-dependent receptor [Caulobacter sp. RHG1]NQE61477.1 hypothetical protein [Caulobacter sp. RHG1]
MTQLRHTLPLLTALLASVATGALAQEATPSTALDQVVVTATARPETRGRVAGTIQVIDEQAIARSPAKSLTELFAENSVAFLSEWSPSQTSINLRGGASDGQGRDYLGEVLVLLNGRRAGTANLSKLSAADISRVEIVRGPASVLYGSQNIGGVVNVILKDGRGAPGGSAILEAGSAGLLKGVISYSGDLGPFDFYVGINAAKKDDYSTGRGGGGTLANTAWKRRGATAALGWDITPLHRVALEARTDGVYDAGFRGSGSNIYSFDDRDNRSLDLTYDGKTADGRFTWSAHGYVVADVDELWQASPIIKNGTLPAPGTAHDNNLRHQWVSGYQIRPTARLWSGNTLVLGLDGERAVLRSTRWREGVPGTTLAQIPPSDNNQTDKSRAYYVEDSQDFFDGRVTVRGGGRWTEGKMSFDPTPNLALQRARTVDYDATTWSLGATWRPIDGLALRAGASTGFRVPSATQLGADFTSLGGGRVFGNPNLRPQTSKQYEIGALWSRPTFTLDAALFQNTIRDRIITVLRPDNTNTSDYANNPGDVLVRGLEVQSNTDLGTLLLGASDWGLKLRAGGYYNFDMADKGAAATLNTNNVQRMYRYEGSFDARVEHTLFGRRAGADLVAILRGPVFYDTEENLLIPQGEPRSNWVHRKSPFVVLNLTGDIELTERVNLSATVTNLLNRNYSTLFIAEDSDPRIADPRFQNGGRGTSNPGREFVARLSVKF